jgi:hypothetical protein
MRVLVCYYVGHSLKTRRLVQMAQRSVVIESVMAEAENYLKQQVFLINSCNPVGGRWYVAAARRRTLGSA